MSKQEIKKQEATVVEAKAEKKEGKVKAWFKRHKGTIKIVLGGTVLATAVGAAWYYFKKHQTMEYDEENDCWYIPVENDVEHVTTIKHRHTTPTKILLDSDSPLSKYGFNDYDLYPGNAELVQDEFGPMKLSDLGDVGEALRDTIPDLEDDSAVWALFNIARNTDEDSNAESGDEFKEEE